MKKQIATAAAAALLAFAALPALAQNVAVVNGKPIPKARLNLLESQIKQEAARTGHPVPPEVEKQLREKLIATEVFAQEAERQGIPATPEFRDQMDLARQAVLVNTLLDNYLKKHPVSDADAKAEYDRVVKQLADQAKQLAAQPPGKEYQVSHILVDKEDQAKDIIAQLKNGAKFADLAKKYSKDPGSAATGGSLGWADPKTYVPEFADALTKLSKGQTTDTPVKSQFGYHIIRLEDIRAAKPPAPPPAPPAFDTVKRQIIQHLEQQKLAAFQKDLRDKAKVQ